MCTYSQGTLMQTLGKQPMYANRHLQQGSILTNKSYVAPNSSIAAFETDYND